MQKYREHDGGRRNWNTRDVGRNLASWNYTRWSTKVKRANACKYDTNAMPKIKNFYPL